MMHGITFLLVSVGIRLGMDERRINSPGIFRCLQVDGNNSLTAAVAIT